MRDPKEKENNQEERRRTKKWTKASRTDRPASNWSVLPVGPDPHSRPSSEVS